MEQKFEFKGLPVRLETDNEDQVWIAGIDVCNILGYANANDAIKKRLDEDERKLEELPALSGQRRRGWKISESGLYSLILSSTLPEAKVFKRWVTHEILPAIRKAGKYTSEQEKEHDLELQTLADEIQQLREDKEDHQKKVNDLKKDIDVKTAQMIAVIRHDKSQLRLEFNQE
jgi:prophage antirepressor-like protein